MVDPSDEAKAEQARQREIAERQLEEAKRLSHRSGLLAKAWRLSRASNHYAQLVNGQYEEV